MNRFLETIASDELQQDKHLSIGYTRQEPHFTDIEFHNQQLYGRNRRTVLHRVNSTP
ncbi:hypothetical protein [Cohnella cholangitidis]|uniref:hypothetical protein n=1 Tax=Cohnella cholangitidis TaxID=2598458 RepID=UPI0015FB6D6B|nr:hypothetical protein [Cohnella cholangitidis]